MFDTPDAMVRIDMSEYMEKHAVSRLVGAPPGYVGYDEGGQLTEAVRRRPYAVVLLDEIEKAHPDVFNVLLQVLDDGRLTDGQGRTVDFKNAVLIMTSNIPGGAAGRRGPLQARVHQPPRRHRRVRPARPRADRRRSSTSRSSTSSRASPSAGSRSSSPTTPATLLGNLGYDPTYGARPLKRVIQKQLVDPLALALLEGEFGEGDTVRVDAQDGELVLERAGAARDGHGQRCSQTTDDAGRCVALARVELQVPGTGRSAAIGNSRIRRVGAIVPHGPVARPSAKVRTARAVGRDLVDIDPPTRLLHRKAGSREADAQRARTAGRR